MARQISTRNSKSPTPVIIGAGITEQWYFTHLRNLLDLRIKIRPRFFGTEDIKQLHCCPVKVPDDYYKV